MKNEKGYTLLIVLLVVTLLSLFSLVLIGSNLNTAKQLKATKQSKLAVNLAEMGITYAKKTVEKEVGSFDLTSLSKSVQQANPNKSADELAVLLNTTINNQIVGKYSNVQLPVESNTINVSIASQSLSKDAIILSVKSIGSVNNLENYTIQAEVAIHTLSMMSSSGGSSNDGSSNGSTGGSNTYTDPKNFSNWETVKNEIVSSSVFPSITNKMPGATYNGVKAFPTTDFYSEVILLSGTEFTVNGDVKMDGNFKGVSPKSVTINGAADFNSMNMVTTQSFHVTSHAKFAGPPTFTSSNVTIDGNGLFFSGMTIDANPITSPTTLTIGGKLWTTSPTTIRNSELDVKGVSSSLTATIIDGGTANFESYAAMNQLLIDHASKTVRTRDLYVGNMSINSSELVVDGSLRTDWSSSPIQSSNITVNGNVYSNNITFGKDGIMTIKGNAEFDTVTMDHHDGLLVIYGNAKINRFQFNKQNKSRVIIYGISNQATLPKDEAWDNYDYKVVKSIDECVQVPNNNIVYFIDAPPPGSGQETSDFNLSISSIDLQHVKY
ncbi:hypothetical protein CN692_23190 [Bacillus sp. AFS002410]|uniref:hypothetical protein n=1 Tax=Bacillus sp. AFS002410 TaxID=2033481 RepID=UPI000BF2496F|nr:hypothetical protein [Bacillus sp. AFS002410]PEJ49353.1 hypothetical protein CN692_23190 [Bacillus sp. AFS002410]